jgi:hypothetical protein
MNHLPLNLRPGDLVEVKPANEILSTLSSDGSLNGLPFMPEMLEYCGQKLRVYRRAVTTCISGPFLVFPRGFKTDKFVTLENVRCSGSAHDGCQKGCMIFWHEAWLRKTDSSMVTTVNLTTAQELRRGIKTKTDENTYWCQASELSKITNVLSKWEKVKCYLVGFRAGHFGLLRMLRSTVTWAFWNIRRRWLGVYLRGHTDPTPTECLQLQPGEWVEVKAMGDILETLNDKGQNRGLSFSPDMRLGCGRRYRVRERLDKIILDGTGKMRQLRNTVSLENSICVCAYMNFGADGCSRCELLYWREIWLRRVDKSV